MTATAQVSSKTETMLVRPYEAADREAVRRLCCDTGFLGDPIDPVFEDRELFADFLTLYYTDHEPQSAFVLEKNGAVKGYLLGSRRRFKLGLATLGHTLANVLKLILRYPGYNAASKRYVHWILWKGWRETPPAPDNAAHFHINILPEARTMEKTRELFNAFFNYLVEQGENRVYGQMVTWNERRTEALFRRYGFKVLNKREITKYRKFTEDRVFLTTCLRELDSSDQDDRGCIRTRQHGIHGRGKLKGLLRRRKTQAQAQVPEQHQEQDQGQQQKTKQEKGN